MAPKLAASGLAKSMGGRLVQDAVSLDLRDGEFLGAVGPSGCGKTTLLRLLAGLAAPDAGQIARRPDGSGRLFCAMVFQDYALLPWRTVLGNIALGPEIRGERRGAAEAIARRHLEAMRLSGWEEHYPSQLSAGMRQRAALARALAAEPEVLLLDEPLAALDAATRRLLQAEILEVHERGGLATLCVTHSIEEALFLCDRVLVLSARPGRVLEEVEVPFGRPRGPGAREDPRFAALAARIWSRLEAEVAGSLAQAA